MNINTDSFYKFTTTLSLIATIYFFSFDEMYLKPHNQYISQANLSRAQLSSDYGYLLGRSLDLTELLKDSINNRHIGYYYESAKGRSEIIKYYSTTKSRGKAKQMIDSLNLINKQFAAVEFKSKALKDTTDVLENNIAIKKIISAILGGISCIAFFGSLILWFKNKHKIDK